MIWIPMSDMSKAISFLYNSTERKGMSGGKPTGKRVLAQEGDLKKFAAIASFMTDEDAFNGALQLIDNEIWNEFSKNPEKYELKSDSEQFSRREILRKDDAAFKKRKGFLEEKGYGASLEGNNANSEKIKLVETKMILRTFKFRPLLQYVEARYHDLKDLGRVMVGNPGDEAFGHVLTEGEVWKDSIAFEHGEYTHRFQWLAIARFFKEGGGEKYGNVQLARDEITRLYKQTSNPLLKKVETALVEKKGINQKVTIANTLWTFLVDAFTHDGGNDKYFEEHLKETQPEEMTVEDVIYAGRTATYRSPRVVTDLIRKGAQYKVLNAYTMSSQMKLDVVKHPGRLEKIDSASNYRRDRLQSRFPQNPIVMQKLDGGKTFTHYQFIDRKNEILPG